MSFENIIRHLLNEIQQYPHDVFEVPSVAISQVEFPMAHMRRKHWNQRLDIFLFQIFIQLIKISGNPVRSLFLSFVFLLLKLNQNTSHVVRSDGAKAIGGQRVVHQALDDFGKFEVTFLL